MLGIFNFYIIIYFLFLFLIYSLTLDEVHGLVQVHLAIGLANTLLQGIGGVHTVIAELGGILVSECWLRPHQLRGIQKVDMVLTI